MPRAVSRFISALPTVPSAAVSTALAAALLLLAAPAASAMLAPAAGLTRVYNHPVCGATYVPVNLGKGDYFNVINAPAHNTCVTVQRHRLSWYVSSWRPADHLWEYPNISSGIEWGRYTCDEVKSSESGGKCMHYPVRVDRDGMPVTSATVHPNISSGNVAYDIWINKTDVSPADLGQPDGAEVMIWLSYPGIANDANTRHVTVDHIDWDVMTWVARNAKTGTTWQYVAYLAHQQRNSVSRLWLNPFFRDAEQAREISAKWYLTAIDFGAEINKTVRGDGFDVAHYSLTGVR